MAGIWRDLRFAARLLARDRWLTIPAVVALSVGLGVTTAVFTLVNAILLRDMPFSRPEQIVWLGTRDPRGQELGVSIPDFDDWKALSRSFSGIALSAPSDMNLLDEDGTAKTQIGAYISVDAFAMLGVSPILGHDFAPEDGVIGAPGRALLGGSLWKNRYGGDPSVLGRTIVLNGVRATIIGVMPDTLRFPFNAEVWIPTSTFSAALRALGRPGRGYHVFGRLADGITVEQARAELAGIGIQLANQYPDTNRDMVPTVTPYVERLVGPQITLMFWSLLGAVGCVLVIACTNVANLLLSRVGRRSHEFAIRTALGATRGRMVGQLLLESALLATLGGAAGCLLSWVSVRWFDLAVQDIGRPNWMIFTMDGRVLSVAILATAASAIAFGLVPALHLARTGVNSVLKEGTRSSSGTRHMRRWSSALIVAELTLTLMLLAAAGLITRGFLRLYTTDVAINSDQLLTMNVRMITRKYPTSESRWEFVRRLEEQISAIAGIRAATTMGNLPMGGGPSVEFEIDGRPSDGGASQPMATLLSAGPRYFEALDLHLVRGRTLTDVDGEPGHETAIVNQRFVAMFLGDQGPIGLRVRFSRGGPVTTRSPWYTIVGVAPTVRQRNIQDALADPVVYIPQQGNPFVPLFQTLVVRSPVPSGQTLSAVQNVVKQLDPDMPLTNVRTMDQHFAQVRWSSRVLASVLTIFAGIALFLSIVGVYAVTSYSVTQRTREVGMRMALGAQSPQIWWLVLRRGLAHLSIGLALGSVGAVATGRLLQSWLVQTEPFDALTLAVVAATLTAASLIASLVPARRATTLDPMVALRHD